MEQKYIISFYGFFIKKKFIYEKIKDYLQSNHLFEDEINFENPPTIFKETLQTYFSFNCLNSSETNPIIPEIQSVIQSYNDTTLYRRKVIMLFPEMYECNKPYFIICYCNVIVYDPYNPNEEYYKIDNFFGTNNYDSETLCLRMVLNDLYDSIPYEYVLSSFIASNNSLLVHANHPVFLNFNIHFSYNQFQIERSMFVKYDVEIEYEDHEHEHSISDIEQNAFWYLNPKIKLKKKHQFSSDNSSSFVTIL